MPRNLLSIIYLIIGVVVASDKNYFEDVDSLKEVLSAIIAVLLWPLVLLGADLHLNVITAAQALPGI